MRHKNNRKYYVDNNTRSTCWYHPNRLDNSDNISTKARCASHQNI